METETVLPRILPGNVVAIIKTPLISFQSGIFNILMRPQSPKILICGACMYYEKHLFELRCSFALILFVFACTRMTPFLYIMHIVEQ